MPVRDNEMCEKANSEMFEKTRSKLLYNTIQGKRVHSVRDNKMLAIVSSNFCTRVLNGASFC